MDTYARQGDHTARLFDRLSDAALDVWFRGQGERAVRAIDRALGEYPLDSIAAVQRPYDLLVWLYSNAGRPDRAREVLSAFDRSIAKAPLPLMEPRRHQMLGDIAFAERRYEDAARDYRASDQGPCAVCALPALALAYDLAGDADSAVAVFTRYLELPSGLNRVVFPDAYYLAGAHKRLGELYDARGDREKATSHYARFVEMWKDADPELQPQVRAARERLAVLQRAERP